MTDMAVATTEQPLNLALLKAVGLDRLAPEQRALALKIAERYELDLLLKHLVMIEGRPYITRDGLLHVAHRSGQLDGIETTEPEIVNGYWRASCSVWRKDMLRAFTYSGRYPTTGGNQKFAPEMALKVAEVAALRRAFDVSAPTAEERWDVEEPAVEAPKPTSLAERVAERRAEVAVPAAGATETAAEVIVTGTATLERPETPAPADPAPEHPAEPLLKAAAPLCGAGSPYDDLVGCAMSVGHAGKVHRSVDGDGVVVATWPLA